MILLFRELFGGARVLIRQAGREIAVPLDSFGGPHIRRKV